jgi:hypothetical protein
LQEEAYLPRSQQSGTLSPDEERSLSLYTACFEATETVKGFIHKRSSTGICHSTYFGAPYKLETYGGKKHLGELGENLVELAYNFYLTVYAKTLCEKPIEVYIVAAESGVFLAMKAFSFLAKHGINPVFRDDYKKFDKAWIEFLIAGEESSTEWPQSLRLVDMISIKLAVFIHPSLPSPTSKLSLYRPRFYDKNPPPIDHAMQQRVLVVWFRNDNIDTSAYEQVPVSGPHIQTLEFDGVLNPSYKTALQTLVENLDAPCSVCG